MFRITLRMQQGKIPLSPFVKGELDFERFGLIPQFTAKAPAEEQRSPLF
jgi:hypothetical protein